jgi:hypothetical protein
LAAELADNGFQELDGMLRRMKEHVDDYPLIPLTSKRIIRRNNLNANRQTARIAI